MNVCDGQNPISNQLINITKKIKQQSSSTKISGTTASIRLCFHIFGTSFIRHAGINITHKHSCAK